MLGYMLDTNIFGKLKLKGLDQKALYGARLYVTHNQWDEIQHTSDEDKRNQLMEVFQQVGAYEEQTISFFLGISVLNKAKLSSGCQFNAMLNRLIELDKEDGKTPPVDNQRRDILIAETAIKLNHTLTTNDGNLRKVVGEFGGHSIKFRTLSSRLAKNGRSFSRE